MRLHHLMEETMTTNDPSLGSLVNTGAIMSTILQKGKVILQTRRKDIGQSHVHRNTHRRSTCRYQVAATEGHQILDDSNSMLMLISLQVIWI